MTRAASRRITIGYRSMARSWFDLGVRAVAALRPDLPAGYVCPLCTGLHPEAEIDQLTLEHVPPGSMDGREMVLTCRGCNVDEGSKSDMHARYREDHFDFAQHTMTQRAPAKMTIGRTTLNAEMISSAEGIAIFGIPEQNHPETPARVGSALEQQGATAAFQLSLTRSRFEGRSANISMLRAAYLAAFALFGYTYAMDPRLDAVREQIRHPAQWALGTASIVEPHANRAARRIVVVLEPAELQSVAVTMGRHTIFLPSIWSTSNIYDVLSARARSESRLTDDIRGKVGPWPRRPMHVLDFEPSQR